MAPKQIFLQILPPSCDYHSTNTHTLRHRNTASHKAVIFTKLWATGQESSFTLFLIRLQRAKYAIIRKYFKQKLNIF